MTSDRIINPRILVWAGIPLLLMAAVFSAAPPAAAGDLEDDLVLHGFVSQGYLNTSRNQYLMPRSVNGTAAYTEAAINLSTQPTDRLRVGIQFLGRNFGATGNDQVLIDWAYGDYRWKDQLGIRAGKVKMPFGLHNEGRDVDMLRTSIFLPQGIYNEKQRDFVLAYEGAGIYGNLDLQAVGELDYHIYAGTLNVPSTSKGFWGDLFANVGQEMEEQVGLAFDQEAGTAPGTSKAAFRSNDEAQVTFPWIYGGSFNWTTPLEGLRFGASGMTGRYNIQSQLRYDVIVPVVVFGVNYEIYYPFEVPVDETVKIDHIAVFSGEYNLNDLTIAAEAYHDRIFGSSTKGWYGSVGYRFSRALSLACYYSDSDPVAAVEALSPGARDDLPDYYGWQRDWTISSRLDLTDFWLFKLEYHFIDGVALTNPRPHDVDLADPMKRKWGMVAAKTTFHF